MKKENRIAESKNKIMDKYNLKERRKDDNYFFVKSNLSFLSEPTLDNH